MKLVLIHREVSGEVISERDQEDLFLCQALWLRSKSTGPRPGETVELVSLSFLQITLWAIFYFA